MKHRPRWPKNNALPVGTPQWYSRGYLPHFDMPGLTQTLTFRLFDSMPQTVLDMWQAELLLLPREDADRERRKRIDAYLDKGHGSCLLKDDHLAEIVQNTLLHFDGQRYALHAWVVMPNHVHALFTVKNDYSISQVTHSWKSYSSHECNRILGRTGEFWQREPFDRFIRNEMHYASALRYIENNPVKAGLCGRPEDWAWSSAGGPGAQASRLHGLPKETR